MEEFKSWQDFWVFADSVRRGARYVRGPDAEGFLATVLATAEKRVQILPEGGFVWRAQLDHDREPLVEDGQHIDDTPIPCPPGRMKPKKDRAKEGRANPKGIPCLYVATNKETALAEARPWIGSLVSVGRFRLNRALRIVNCAVPKKSSWVYTEGEPSADKREESVWSCIDQAFAMPVTRVDDLADYAPTQVIAELFKMHGFDGIAYASSLGPGHNIALFYLDVADLVACFLFEVGAIHLQFGEVGTPYFMQVHKSSQ